MPRDFAKAAGVHRAADSARGCMRFSLAAGWRGAQALQTRDMLRQKMDPDEIARAEKLSRAWVAAQR